MAKARDSKRKLGKFNFKAHFRRELKAHTMELKSYSLIIYQQSLFELELAGCNEVTEAGLWSCLTPRIVSLSLADCINIADEAVGAVAQLLPSLYEFSLQVFVIHSEGCKKIVKQKFSLIYRFSFGNERRTT